MTPTPSTTEDLASLPRAERWKRAVVALRKIIADPDQTDQVLVFLSLINSGSSTTARIDRFFADPAGQTLYDQHRAIDSRTVDLDALAALPEGTLGHAYAKFLRSRGLTPEVFDGPPEGIADPRRSYVVQRLRQTHDLWHVVTGCETDPAGEVALQAFTYAQLAGQCDPRAHRRDQGPAPEARHRARRDRAVPDRRARRSAAELRVGGPLGDPAARGSCDARTTHRASGSRRCIVCACVVAHSR
jgi:hypothetical protein